MVRFGFIFILLRVVCRNYYVYISNNALWTLFKEAVMIGVYLLDSWGCMLQLYLYQDYLVKILVIYLLVSF